MWRRQPPVQDSRSAGVIAPALRILVLPFPAVEGPHGHLLEGAGVEAAGIDAETVGMGARDVERLDAAHRAEEMLRRAGVESVSREHVLAREQLEVLRAHDEMQVAGLAAHRAVAVRARPSRGRERLESDPAAVAAPAVRDQRL